MIKNILVHIVYTHTFKYNVIFPFAWINGDINWWCFNKTAIRSYKKYVLSPIIDRWTNEVLKRGLALLIQN